MRETSEAFAARLAADGTTLCACWRFTRRDAAVFGATDHDRAIEFDGVTYEPTNGLKAATFESSAGLAPGRAAADGAISAEFMSETDLDAGLWDGARVDVWRVDWAEPEHRVRIWSGRLSEVTRRGAAFTVELVSLKADLERPIGRVYARRCDAELGDARCRVDPSHPEFAGGCDKSFATCKATFGNRDNFRGFPHMPGPDAVLAGPASDRPNDGGRRE